MLVQVSIRCAQPGELDLLRAIDDESGELFLQHGVDLSALSLSHPFVQAEQESWKRALAEGRAHVATRGDEVLGFSVLDRVDDAPYLEQLSVRLGHMRRGIGSLLLRDALARSGGLLWLTTYAHVPWNAPYYQRFGFRIVPEHACGPGMRITQAC